MDEEELEELRRLAEAERERKRKMHRDKVKRLRLQATPEQVERRRVKQSQWTKTNLARLVETRKDRRRANKQRAVEAFNNTCNHCGGVFHPAVFEFHHINDAEKQHEISVLMSSGGKRLENELRKCIMLCANCHRLLHAKEDGWIVNSEC